MIQSLPVVGPEYMNDMNELAPLDPERAMLCLECLNTSLESSWKMYSAVSILRTLPGVCR